MNKEGFRYYNYSDAFYNAIVEYLQTNTLTDNLPFANSRHKTKWIQRLNQYELVRNDLYFTDVTTGKKYLVIKKDNISQYLQSIWYNNRQGYRGRDAFYNKIKDLMVGIT